MTNMPPRLSRLETSAYLLSKYGLHHGVVYLAQLSHLGRGPAFRKIGAKRVAYDVPEIDRWVEEVQKAKGMTRIQAAAYLHSKHDFSITVSYLSRLAALGKGPAFRRLASNIVAYDEAELDRYAAEMISAPRTSTSQTG